MNKLVTALRVVLGVFYAVYFWVNLREMLLNPWEMLAYGLVGALLLMLILRGGEYEVAEESGETEEEEGKMG